MNDVIRQAKARKSPLLAREGVLLRTCMDKIDIQENINSGSGIPVEFIANEFLGNKTIYFLKLIAVIFARLEAYEFNRPQKFEPK